MNKTCNTPITCFIVAGLFCLVAGCTAVGTAGRSAGRADTELRGVLSPPATNELAGVVAVLHSRYGTRQPCRLIAADAAVAEDIQAFAAKGAVVIVAGDPGPESFTVHAVWTEGKRRHKEYAGDADVEDRKEDAWPGIQWGNVPAGAAR